MMVESEARLDVGQSLPWLFGQLLLTRDLLVSHGLIPIFFTILG
jgi:hypothetical protein